jgi:periplasmic protein TonB
MSPARPFHDDRRLWSASSGLALALHIGVAVLVLAWARPAQPPVPDPVVLVELPPEAPPAQTTQQPIAQAQPEAAQQPQRPTLPTLPTLPIDVPLVRAPLPREVVTLPRPVPVRAPEPAAVSTPAPAAPVARTEVATTPVSDAKARKQEADYFALVSAHLNRRKTYPAEAKQARQQGVVTVRFTVDRNGTVSGSAIKRSSGHAILDAATLDLLRRVAPLPRMPASMLRDSITLSLPIDYSLRTS